MIKYFLCENATGEIVIDGQKKKMKVIKLQLISCVKILKDGIVINVVVIVKIRSIVKLIKLILKLNV